MADTLHVLILDGGAYDMKPVGFPSAAQSEAAERFPADRGGTNIAVTQGTSGKVI